MASGLPASPGRRPCGGAMRRTRSLARGPCRRRRPRRLAAAPKRSGSGFRLSFGPRALEAAYRHGRRCRSRRRRSRPGDPDPPGPLSLRRTSDRPHGPPRPLARRPAPVGRRPSTWPPARTSRCGCSSTCRPTPGVTTRARSAEGRRLFGHRSPATASGTSRSRAAPHRHRLWLQPGDGVSVSSGEND